MDPDETFLLSNTESVCPECLARIPAVKFAVGQNVLMRKTCPEHGDFTVTIWRGEPAFSDWIRAKIPCHPKVPKNSIERGCPFDCGLCPDHRQQTCTALLEITRRCNLKCAYCFADSGNQEARDPGIEVIKSWYESLKASGHPCNIQLSGGEPTVRDDLPQIIAMGISMGFKFIQLNTNGIRLASDLTYVERLKKAGLASVFLQFDGTNDQIYTALRRGNFLQSKLRAIRNCGRQNLGVILVPTLVHGLNTDDIGNIIRLAIDNIDVVRGVHFQPVSYFGRYPKAPVDHERLTLPDLMRLIEMQTSGAIKAANFRPPGCENALCSFHGNFVLMPDGKLIPLSRFNRGASCCEPELAESGALKTRHFVSTHWAAPSEADFSEQNSKYLLGDWDILLHRSRTHMLCISAMGFQDVWNLDIERLKDCCIHVVAGDGEIIPFCAYNLTSAKGEFLYRGSVE
ncbi:MAG: radical SAM protein [Deltaproteobacteria bacterium]|nr:radical SAM protein [Deltaproteobacteria bacterium]